MIDLGIVGYGNLARGVEHAIGLNSDLRLKAVFTRRDPESVQILTPGVPVRSVREISVWRGRLDVMILCGGSAEDLPRMTPELARLFHVVDSFDTHARIPAHFAAVDAAALAGGNLAIISAGWDPGLFSLMRLYADVVLPDGETYTFWGPGISQGHSDAIRRIPGVLDARQYTIPEETVLRRVRNGECPQLSAREMHVRRCFVAVEEGSDRAAVEHEIKSMPDYFAGYDTTVEFVDPETLRREHIGFAHGGSVIRNGRTGGAERSCRTIEYRLQLESNPQLTGCVLAACARAVFRLAARGERGCRTMLDLAPADLSTMSREKMLERLL